MSSNICIHTLRYLFSFFPLVILFSCSLVATPLWTGIWYDRTERRWLPRDPAVSHDYFRECKNNILATWIFSLFVI